MYIFNKAHCYFMKLEKISSSAPGWLDDPSRVSCWPSISSHVIRLMCENRPPPAVKAWADYLTLAF
jgi:hypothetical protein